MQPRANPMELPLGPAFSPGAVEALASGEPEWLAGRRREAWRRFEATPWPSATDEAWRRTDLGRLDFGSIASLAGSMTAVEGGIRMGQVREGPVALPDRPLHGAKLVALNEALAGDGVLVLVGRGENRRARIRREAGRTFFPRTLVHLEEGGQATVLEELSGGGPGGGLASTVTELSAGRSSHLVYLRLQGLGPGLASFETIRAFLERDSDLTLVLVNAGAGLTKQFIDVRLVGEGARLTVLGLTMGRDDQRFDIHATVVHEVAHATSDLTVKTALDGRARSVFVGTLRVEPGAVGTDAFETNRNLLLSGEARADSIPRLEIETDDVRCSHASSTGPVDEDQLFYMMSRGLARSSAQRLIVEGFFDDVLSRVPLDSGDETMRQAAREAIVRATA